MNFKIYRTLKALNIFVMLCVLIVMGFLYVIVQLMNMFSIKYPKAGSHSYHFTYSKAGENVIMTYELGNFEPKYKENRSTKPGENGVPCILPENLKKDAENESLKYGMNIICSNHISLNRTIPDTRHLECKYWKYPANLPSASVIIIFRNEELSVILRTIHSVINRTPPELLKEVILVNDFSDEELNEKIAIIIENYKKVRIIYNNEHQGLIKSKNIGASSANGDVIVFLDAHCEVNINWLPPLLAPIYTDKKTLTVPLIDEINDKTFEYTTVYDPGVHYRGIFEWGLLYKETKVPINEFRHYDSEPYTSPTHAGGILAISREYFLYLGGYDRHLNIWGGENFDLSFKIWLCGGRILWVPCSRVGHVYRGFRKNKPNIIHTVLVNYKRVVETWFDDKHKQYFYTRQPIAAFETVNVTEQLELKEKLKCKNFDWYMKNIAYDVYESYPELPPNLYWGHIGLEIANKCLEGDGNGSFIRLNKCVGPYSNSKQYFRFNILGQLALGEWCVVAESDTIKLAACKEGTVDGPWKFESTNKVSYTERLLMRHTDLNKCLTFVPENDLKLLPCSEEQNVYQKWVLVH